MLYKLTVTSGTFDGLEPVPFTDFSNFGQREGDLERLIAANILDVLLEDERLTPVFQERTFQAEADIYALDERGDLFIIELKRGSAGDDALIQVLRYAQDAGQWNYARLEAKYRRYTDDKSELLRAHQEAFSLDRPLDAKEVNRRQHLVIIGNAADDSLINAVHYWRRQGISIQFLPYRVYELADEQYFEFFALPYDKHRNPGQAKGVLFDTNRSYNEEALWEMMENEYVAVYGDAQRFIDYLHPGDTVFFSHVGAGVVAAAKVENAPVQARDPETRYRRVKFPTPVPARGGDLRAMPPSMVSGGHRQDLLLGGRTIKVPNLTAEEAERLACELRQYLEADA